MKKFSRWLLVANVVAGCASGGDSNRANGSTGADGTVDTNQSGDATDATDGSDATNSQDGTVGDDADGSVGLDTEPDGSDVSVDATDATDGTADATDGTADATDGTADATDGTADATDGTADATDGTADATDGTADATDGTADATDATDGSDGSSGSCPAVMGTLALNVASSGNTAGKASNYEDCSDGSAGSDGSDSSDGQSSGDEAWVFTAPEDGVFSVDIQKDFSASVFVQTDCNASATCLASAFSPKQTTLDVKLDSGESVLIVVDGDLATEEGPYTITVHEPCLPQCDGKECGDDGCGQLCGTCTDGFCQNWQCMEFPTTCEVVDTVVCGQTLEGLSNGMPGAVSAFSGYTCSSSWMFDDFSKSPEAIFQFSSDIDQLVTIEGANTGTLEMIVLEDGGEGCVDTGASCILGAFGSGTFEAKAGVNYYIVWDNYDGSAPIVEDFGMQVTCCQPSCEGRTCGDDGCSGSCGTCNSGFCVDGQCTKPSKTCEPVAAVSCGDALVNQSNGVPGVTSAFSKYNCFAGESAGLASSAELTYSFTSESDQIVTIDSENNETLQLFVLEDKGDGCANSIEGCVASAYGDLTFDAKAGKTYYLVWDSYDVLTPLVSGFSFDVQCCAPTCDDVVCGGDDGCGGTCGCSDGETCGEDSICVPEGVGEGCGDPGLIDGSTLPTTVSGSLLTSSDSINLHSRCGYISAGTLGVDNVYRFEAPEDGYYTLTLDPGSYSAVLYVTTSCETPSAGCLAGDKSNGFGSPITVGVTLSQGETVFVMVEGYFEGIPVGAYELTVSNPEPLGPGDGCFDPIEVDTVPFSFEGNTADGIDSAWYSGGGCGDGMAFLYTKDQTLHFQAPDTGKYPLTVTPDFDAIIIVTSTCSDVNGGCIAGGSVTAGTELSLVLDLDAGQDVFINVDNTFVEGVGTYGLAIGDIVSDGDGDSCDNPIALGGTLPIAVSGDTSPPNLASDYEVCSGDGTSYTSTGSDVIYTFTPPSTGVYVFNLEGWDVAFGLPTQISVRSSCDDTEDSCVDGIDLYDEENPLAVSLEGGKTYYVAVASYYSYQEGPFTLTIDTID